MCLDLFGCCSNNKHYVGLHKDDNNGYQAINKRQNQKDNKQILAQKTQQAYTTNKDRNNFQSQISKGDMVTLTPISFNSPAPQVAGSGQVNYSYYQKV